MATKLFTESVTFLTENGMAEREAKYLARVACGHASKVGLGEYGLAEISAKSSSKSFTTSAVSTVKRELKKGELLTVGEVGWLFLVQTKTFLKSWPGVLRELALPTGLLAAYAQACKVEDEAKAKEEKEEATK
jgi:hypothetical protein